ncbi:MAG: flavin reductase [Dehalococcoidia bacterium]|nr:flavin reductase [Dehalococcoidia bacterium]
MDDAAKKHALRLIPYGMFVLTSRSKDGKELSTGTINWITQASFAPPLVVVGVKGDSHLHAHIKDSGVFAVNVLGKEHKDLAFTFFKPATVEGNLISGQPFEAGKETGCALLTNLPAWWECKLVGEVSHGDHTVFVGEVIEAGVRNPDDACILMRDHNLNYGG